MKTPKKPSRRTVHNTNRGANKFNLKPMSWKPEVVQVDIPEPATEVEQPEVTPASDMEPEPIFIMAVKAVKPKNWPWNKRLLCCGQVERECNCGQYRIYN